MKKLALSVLSLAMVWCASCGGGGGAPSPPPAVTISISPASATVEIGGTAQFTATVRNTTNTAVTWQVNGITGGNATVGTIDTSGLYTAPTSVPSPAEVTVTAVSQADTSKTASATVTIKLRITVMPSTATVPAAATQQFNALVEGVANTAVTWQVNGIAGGNAAVGTISLDGVYIAPLAIPLGGTVTVTAVAQADTSRSDSASVTITHSLAMLSGQYAFSFWGFDPDLFYNAGSIVADGNGMITDGVLDLNTFRGVFPNLGLSGTYTVSEDGRVEFLLVDSDNFPYTLRAVLISPNRLHVIEFDAFAAGQGFIEKQDPDAFNDAAFAGGYALRFEGVSATGIIMFAGRMTADGAGNLTAGVMDINDFGVADTRSAPFTGTYAIAANGRGTVSLDTGTAMGILTFAVYMISSSKAYFVSLDFVPAFLGTAEEQTLASFSDAHLAGEYVFTAAGFTNVGFYYNVGRFTANGSGTTAAGVMDENNEGVTEENIAFTGTYSIAANGRGTAVLSSTLGTSEYSFYMVSPTRAFFVEHGTFAVTSGDVDAQQGGPFSTASVEGSYGFSGEGSDSYLLGQFNATGAGAVAGTVDITVIVNGGAAQPTPDQAFNATYSVTNNGRGDYTVTGAEPSQFHIYVISPSNAVLIGINEVLLMTAEKQF